MPVETPTYVDRPGGGDCGTGGCYAQRAMGLCGREPVVARGLCLACVVDKCGQLRAGIAEHEARLAKQRAELEDLLRVLRAGDALAKFLEP